MNKISTFFKKNMKSVAISFVMVLFVLSIFLGCGFFVSDRKVVSADTISGNWRDSGNYASGFSGGNGSSGDPYQISSAGEFAYLANQINSGDATINNNLYYKLVKPIDLSAHYWTPIGNETYRFSGNIDCNNQPILGLTVSDQEKSGLFGFVDDLTISNVIIMNAEISADLGNEGIIAGEVNGAGITITNAQIEGTIKHTYPYSSANDAMGGLIGCVKGGVITITNVYLKLNFDFPGSKGDNCVAPFIGCVDPRGSISEINISESYVRNGDSDDGVKTANFAGTDWFTYSGLNNGFPLLKSQYWIGKNKSYSEEPLSEFLEDTENSEYLACQPTFYTVKVTTNKGEASVESRSTVGAGTSIKAVRGELVKLSYQTLEGYEFFCRVTADKSIAFDSENQFKMPSADVLIELTYTPMIYTISYNLDGGTAENPSTYTVEDEITLNNPVKPGYTFLGWTGANGDTPQTSVTIPVGSLGYRTYTANWQINYSYFPSNWQSKIASGLGSTVATVNPKINKITFTKEEPTFEETATVTEIKIGAISETSTTMYATATDAQKIGVEDITAYVEGSSTYNITFYSPCTIYAPKSSNYLFSNSSTSLSSLTSINFDNFDTSKVTKMDSMFNACYKIMELDLSGFDTSKVTDMSDMFYYCSALTSLDVSGFSTDKVTDMSSMFSYCEKITTLDLSNFNTSNVIWMSSMFRKCSSLTSLDVSKFNTSKTKEMWSLFSDCSSLTELDVSGFDTSSVNSTMSSMFYNCKKLKTLDVSNFNTSNVTNMSAMFYDCTSLTALDVSGFDTSNVTSMSYMFRYSHVTTLDVSNFNTSKVTDMTGMFYSCNNITSLDLSNFNTEKVTSMSSMFYECNALTSINLSNFNTSKATSMSRMFCGCWALTSLDLRNFDASKATSLNEMFYECRALTSLDLSGGFNTSNITNMQRMFSNCSSLTEIKGLTTETLNNNFDTSTVTSMSYMFYNCSKLTSLDLSSFNTASVTTMLGMFSNCSGLISLDVSNFNTSNVTNMNNMFYFCKALTSLDLSNFNTSNVTNMSAMFYECLGLTGTLLLTSFNTSNVTEMGSMFYGCEGLTSLDLSSFDTSSVKNMNYMFRDCFKLTSLNLCSFNTSNVTTMVEMFYCCHNLVEIKGLTSDTLNSNFNTANVKHMTHMFYSCGKLTSLDLSGFDMSSVTSADGTFSGCSNLKVLQTPKNCTLSVTLPKTMYDEDGTEYTSLPKNSTSSIDLRRAYTVTLSSTVNGTTTTDTRLVRHGKTYGEWTSAQLPTLSEEGYTFNGWYTASSSGTQKINGSRLYQNANHTLYAHWTECDVAYLRSDWLSVLGIQRISVTSIEFRQSTSPTGTSVGATSITGDTAYSSSTVEGIYDVKASLSNGALVFSSQAEKIYAPQNSTRLFGAIEENANDRFYNLKSFTCGILDTSQVTNMVDMFFGAVSLSYMDLSSFDMIKVTGEYSAKGMLDVAGLTVLKTPMNCSQSVGLYETLYASTGTKYTSLPMNLTESIELRTAFTVTLSSTVNGTTTTYTRLARYEKTYGEWPSAQLPTLSEEGYTFNGWYTAASGGTQKNNGDSLYNSNAKHTLYAHWTGYTYTVKYNANGGTGSMSSSSHTYGVAKNLTANAFTRTGYTFNGWNTKADGTGTSYTNSQSVSNLSTANGATVNLYAQWVKNTYTVIYNANGGSGTMSNSSHTYGVAKNLTANAFTRTGYTFNGWNTKADGTGTSYTNSQSVSNLSATNGATVNLYAQWTAIYYSVTLASSSVGSYFTASINKTSVAHNQTVTLTITGTSSLISVTNYTNKFTVYINGNEYTTFAASLINTDSSRRGQFTINKSVEITITEDTTISVTWK